MPAIIELTNLTSRGHAPNRSSGVELLLLILLLAVGPVAVLCGADTRSRDTRRVERWWPGARC
jgi:hypothetical protein